MYNDPDGKVISPYDAAIDIGFLLFDLYDLARNGPSKENSVNLAMDTASFAPGALPLALLRTGKIVGESANLAKKADNLVNLASKDLQVNNVLETRPKFRKATEEKAWGEATNGPVAGTKVCPTCGKIITGEKVDGKRDFDLDHYKQTWKDTKEKLKNIIELTRKEVISIYQNGVRVQCPTCNRSNKFNPTPNNKKP